MSLLWQYLLIFLGVAIEGPGVTLAAAALAGTGALDPYVVFLSAGSGNLIGDLVWYFLGYVGRVEPLFRWFPALTRLRPQINRLKAEMQQNATRMLFVAKLAFGVASIPTLVAAGLVHVPWQRVVPIQLLGETIWTGSLVLFGVFLGQYVAQFERDLRIASLGSAVLIVVLVVWLIRRRLAAH